MNGEIQHVIALISHGNGYLLGTPHVDLSAFYPSNDAFARCEYVRFADLNRKGGAWDEALYATDPPAWFARLKKDGVNAIRVVYRSTEGVRLGNKVIPDRMLAGSLGMGGRWQIEAMKSGKSDLWEARWEALERDRRDENLWRATHYRLERNRPTVNPPAVDISSLKKRLADNLEAIGNFARKQELDEFAAAFATGLARLSSQEPHKDWYHGYLVSDQALPLWANQLLGAAHAAWQFGRMCSWNDLGFKGEDQVLYEQLSEELYQLLCVAIVTGTNASATLGPRSSPGSAAALLQRLTERMKARMRE